MSVEAQGDVLARARDGDERAFLALFRAAQPTLLRYLAVIVGDAADEIAAQTWIEIGRDLPVFTGSLDDFRAWVASVGRRRALDHLDALRTVERLPRQVPPGETALAAAPPATAAALRMVAALGAEESEAILLRSVMGLDDHTSATLLGLRRSALRRAAVRGLRALGRRLESASGPTSGAADGAAATAVAGRRPSVSAVGTTSAAGRPLRVVTLPEDVEAHAVGQNTPLSPLDLSRLRGERPERTERPDRPDRADRPAAAAGGALTPNRGLGVIS